MNPSAYTAEPAGAKPAGELLISAGRKSEYQIVLPDKTLDPIVDRALVEAADVMREMFQANGCTIAVVKESQTDKQKPGATGRRPNGRTAARRARWARCGG